MRPRDSLLARGLEPLAAGMWTLFVLVSLLVAAVWVLGLGEASLRAVSSADLRATLVWLLAHIDLFWIALAAINAYLSLAADAGLATARRWALLILGAVIAMAWVSVAAGVPLGRIRYGSALGLKLGPVPLGLPLFWFSVIIGAREALLRFFPRLGHAPVAAGVGLLALFTDLNLEPLATKLHGFWFWLPTAPTLPPVFDPPFTGNIAWGMLAGLLALFLRERDVAASARPRLWRPAATLAIFHTVFLATHAAHRL